MKKVKKETICTKTNLNVSLIRIWDHDEVKNSCKELTESMQNQLEITIKSKLKHTKY